MKEAEEIVLHNLISEYTITSVKAKNKFTIKLLPFFKFFVFKLELLQKALASAICTT